MIPGSRMQLWTFLADRTYQRDIKPVPTLSCGGVFRYRSGERLHGMQEVSGSIPLFSTKKALYFAGSTVLFFLSKPVSGGCIASPAPFSGFSQATQLHLEKEMLPPEQTGQNLGKLWGQHSSFYGSVRCGCRDTPPTRHTRRAADGSRPAGRIRRSGRRSRRPAPPRGSGRCSPFPVRWPRGRR